MATRVSSGWGAGSIGSLGPIQLAVLLRSGFIRHRNAKKARGRSSTYPRAFWSYHAVTKHPVYSVQYNSGCKNIPARRFPACPSLISTRRRSSSSLQISIRTSSFRITSDPTLGAKTSVRRYGTIFSPLHFPMTTVTPSRVRAMNIFSAPLLLSRTMRASLKLLMASRDSQPLCCCLERFTTSLQT